MMGQLSGKESVLVVRFAARTNLLLLGLPLVPRSLLLIRVEVLDHAADDVHYGLIRVGITQVELIDDACEFEQVLNTLLMLLRVAVAVHEDLKADLLRQLAVLFQTYALTKTLLCRLSRSRLFCTSVKHLLDVVTRAVQFSDAEEGRLVIVVMGQDL